MRTNSRVLRSFPRQLALVTLASAIALPVSVWAQDQVSTGTSSGVSSQSTPSSTAQQQQQPSPAATQPLTTPKEGFWGRVNPFARKKWVKRQIDPINDRLSELDEVNAKNAAGHQGCGCAGAGRHPEGADQQPMRPTRWRWRPTARRRTRATPRATGIGSCGPVEHHGERSGSVSPDYRPGDQVPRLKPGTHVEIRRRKLDQLAASLTGREGYILELEAHSPLAGSAGIQSSERLAEAVKRYLVTEHQIPVYRMHSVALGNEVRWPATATGDQESKAGAGTGPAACI